MPHTHRQAGWRQGSATRHVTQQARCATCPARPPQIPRWDTSAVRPKGARLKTFGGRASGPEPLESLFLFAVQTFQKARGRRMTPLECHDLVCKIAEIVVVGGVRRWVRGKGGRVGVPLGAGMYGRASTWLRPWPSLGPRACTCTTGGGRHGLVEH